MKTTSPSTVVKTSERLRGCPPGHQAAELSRSATAAFEQRLREAIAEAIRRAPQPEQVVLSLLYEHAMGVHEVGSVLGLSDEQVYALHAHSIARLCGRVMEPSSEWGRALGPQAVPRRD
jgi:DNA-directed RNA polymerase specialized sigma subunit